MSPIPEEEREKPGQADNNEIEDTEYPDVVINAGSSDSDNDDDDDGYMGYQTLAQDPGAPDSDDEHTAVDEEPSGPVSGQPAGQGPPTVPLGLLHNVRHEDFPNTPNLPGYMQVPDLPRPDKTEMLWNQPHTSQDIRLDTGQAEKIRSLMSGIQLPSSNIPDWARGLSDDQWHAQVVNRLGNPRTGHKHEAGVAAPSSKQTREPSGGDTEAGKT